MSTEITAEVRAEIRNETHLWCRNNRDRGCDTCETILSLLDALDALDAEERVGQEHVESLAEDCEEQRSRAERAEARVARVKALSDEWGRDTWTHSLSTVHRRGRRGGMSLTPDERRVLRAVDGNVPGGTKSFRIDSVIEHILAAHEMRAYRRGQQDAATTPTGDAQGGRADG